MDEELEAVHTREGVDVEDAIQLLLELANIDVTEDGHSSHRTVNSDLVVDEWRYTIRDGVLVGLRKRGEHDDFLELLHLYRVG